VSPSVCLVATSLC